MSEILNILLEREGGGQLSLDGARRRCKSYNISLLLMELVKHFCQILITTLEIKRGYRDMSEFHRVVLGVGFAQYILGRARLLAYLYC